MSQQEGEAGHVRHIANMHTIKKCAKNMASFTGGVLAELHAMAIVGVPMRPGLLRPGLMKVSPDTASAAKLFVEQ